MIQHRFIAPALAAALAAGLPAAAAAQAPATTSPEGPQWTLTSYRAAGAGELASVPFDVQASLLLQDGTASGSGGCNQFSGSYQLDGSSLRFADELSVTLALCEDDVQLIEDAYLAALSDVDGWIIDGGVLQLVDDFGDVILTFEVPGVAWTASQASALLETLAGLQSEVATLRADVDALREATAGVDVVRLRERIKSLERKNRELTERLDAVEQESATADRAADRAAFSNTERVLLEGIPGRIASTCSPLRASLPKGTRAAVSCRPNTSAVSSVNYYLLEGEAAAAVFGDTMATFNVPDAISETETCAQGVKSQRVFLGSGWQAEGCWRANLRAELRFVDNATDCRQLRVGNKTLSSPAIYIEVQGTDNDVERVHGWATRNIDAGASQLTSITQPIKRPKAALSPSCPT